MFVFIGLAILGGLTKKLKSHNTQDSDYKVPANKNMALVHKIFGLKYKFMIGAFVSIIFIALTFGYQTIECVYNLMVGLINYGNNAYGDYANKNEYF
jgi:hypothetical protein